MKKNYEAPKVEKIQFDYAENVVASNGKKYRKYIDGYEDCNDTPTDEWYIINDLDMSICTIKFVTE